LQCSQGSFLASITTILHVYFILYCDKHQGRPKAIIDDKKKAPKLIQLLFQTRPKKHEIFGGGGDSYVEAEKFDKGLFVSQFFRALLAGNS
jgi:hypothetical protein